LRESIKAELSGLFLNFSLYAFFQINQYLEGNYYESKQERVQTLQKQLETEGLEKLVITLIAMAIHKPVAQTIQQATGYVQAHMPHRCAIDRAKTAAELIAVCSKKTGLYYICRNGPSVPISIKVNHVKIIRRKLLSALDWINDTCFNPPLVEKPKPVSNNIQCGYHNINEPLILGDLTMHEHRQNYKTVNLLNKIEWVIDKDVLAIPETPAKPLETKTQIKLFKKMVKGSKYIYGLIKHRCFYFVWQYDCRGRMYSHGYHVNFQSNEYKKALLSFNHYEVLI
jgi:hypothetical protein